MDFQLACTTGILTFSIKHVLLTPNFDNRSFHLNFEVASVIVDEGFAQKKEAMFEADFRHADVIDAESFDDPSTWWRIGVGLSRLAAPVLSPHVAS